MENKSFIQRNKKPNSLQQKLEEKINIINTQENTIRNLYDQIEKLTIKDEPNIGCMAQINEPTTSKLVQANLDLAIAITEEINLLSNYVYTITGKDINTSVARTSNISTHVINEAMFKSNQNFDWILSKFRELNKELSNHFTN